jgi:hypothetical protein
MGPRFLGPPRLVACFDTQGGAEDLHVCSRQAIFQLSGGEGLFLYLGIHRRTAGMGTQIYQWDAIFINLLYQWIDTCNLAYHYINGW